MIKEGFGQFQTAAETVFRVWVEQSRAPLSNDLSGLKSKTDVKSLAAATCSFFFLYPMLPGMNGKIIAGLKKMQI